MKRSYLIAAGIAIAVAAWILSGQVGSRQSVETSSPPAKAATEVLPQVRVRTLTAETHANELVLFGRTEAERTVNLRTETAGQVEALAARKGERVAAGDVIVRLAMDDRDSRLSEAEARVEQFTIAYEAAVKLSEREFRSRVNVAETKAGLEAAKAALARIRLDIRNTQIRAPFAGVISALPVEVGDFVEVGAGVASVIDLDPILVVAEVGERHVSQIAPGAPAKARLPSGEPLDGTVRFVSRTGDPATRTFRVEVAVPNPGGDIAEGMTTELRLPLGATRAHRVSPSVLTLSDDGVIGVKTIDAGGVVEFRPVTMIADTPAGMWLAGLPETVTLITVGQEFVLAGQRVRPVPEAAVSAASPRPSAPGPQAAD